MRMMLPLILLATVAGCATGPGQNSTTSPQAVEVRAKLSLGGCGPELADQVLALDSPGLEQETAYQCLQEGQLAT